MIETPFISLFFVSSLFLCANLVFFLFSLRLLVEARWRPVSPISFRTLEFGLGSCGSVSRDCLGHWASWAGGISESPVHCDVGVNASFWHVADEIDFIIHLFVGCYRFPRLLWFLLLVFSLSSVLHHFVRVFYPPLECRLRSRMFVKPCLIHAGGAISDRPPFSSRHSQGLAQNSKFVREPSCGSRTSSLFTLNHLWQTAHRAFQPGSLLGW